MLLTLVLAGCGATSTPTDAGFDGQDAGGDPNGDAGVDAGTLVAVWRPVAATPVPTGLWGTELTFDPVDRRFIVHGGNTYPTGDVTNDTYSYSIATDTWTKLTTTGDAPPLRYCHCTAFLPTTREVLVAGGRNGSTTVDSAYTLDLATLTWRQVMGAVPTGAIGCVGQWMPKLGRAVVFSGEGMAGLNSITWTYDPATRAFSKAAPPFTAPPRRDAMRIYDPVQERLFVFGGAERIFSSYFEDLAIYDGTTWFNPTPPWPHPSPRRYGASGYDAKSALWMLFGGTNDTDDYGDLWLIDPLLSTFTETASTGGPGPRGFAASGVDEVTGRLYVFGGLHTQGFTAISEGWSLALERH
ncbi:MAG: kelch repeat-containing protein [Myxococcaceae bacterium]